MNTAFALLSRYDGLPIVPVEDVCRDFFRHLSVKAFREKMAAGEITIPIVRIDDSVKSALGIHVEDLAAYLDERIRKARKEAAALAS